MNWLQVFNLVMNGVNLVILGITFYFIGRSRRAVQNQRRREQDLVEAIRLTVEYVGLHTLPPLPGWSWFDALSRHDPELAATFAAQWERDEGEEG